MTMTDSHQLNAQQLARLADCASPDSETSHGAEFPSIVQVSVNEALGDGRLDDDEPSDVAHEIADGCVPVYTIDVWRTFVDLAAWQEGPSELGVDASDMEQAAKVCLYMIAERLVYALLEREGHDDA